MLFHRHDVDLRRRARAARGETWSSTITAAPAFSNSRIVRIALTALP
jgi:hypothetical protein